MYNKELEELIDAALEDGVLTEKEKQVLFKRAQSMGIDLDEFEMVLDARLVKLQKEEKAKAQAAAPKSDKYGDVKKCPACGAMIESFTARCPSCGHEFSNIAANSSIQKLFEMLNKVEAESKDDPKTILGSVGRTYGQMFSPFTGGDKDTRKKKTIIQNFPIPTTKDDILEFLTLAVPLAKKPSFFKRLRYKLGILGTDNAEIAIQPIWKAKCEQIIMKAKFSMQGDTKTLDMIREYANELRIKM